MKVKVKLFATLQRYAPEGQFAGEPFEMELPEGSPITAVIERLAIRPHEVKVTFVNGKARAEVYRLKEGDEIGIFPPVGGG